MKRAPKISAELDDLENFQKWIISELAEREQMDVELAAELRKGVAELRAIAHEKHAQGELREMQRIERDIAEAEKRATSRINSAAPAKGIA